ncbi:MAG: YbhB/YbcL family Raf kinase inhibitor-like protein [Actinobacteria bacterium]|nr:YbhB/YbcL family Raf kinase inhibitor-like protein [Actinomycetota bacterium]MDA3017457.1 YbhB/YbcL family Raf kinase inhibitor-like protein [Actinomycetota bacterium]
MQVIKTWRSFSGLIVLAIVLTACSRDGRELREAGPGQGESVAIITTTLETVVAEQDPAMQNVFSVSGTWLANGALDPRHTCLGSNISPALVIENTPAEAKSLAMTLIAVDNPQQPLWVVANLDPTLKVIQEGGVPTGAIVGAAFNGDKIVDGYSGPCPIDNEIHEFLLVVYAIDQQLEFTPEPQSLASSQLLVQAIQSAAFDSAETRFFVQNP